MAQTVLITLTLAGTDTGPFDLYSDADAYVTPFENDVPKASLVAGYTSVLVPDLATIIRVQSDSLCTNYIDLPIVVTTTTTTTTEPPPPITCSVYTIDNQAGAPVSWTGELCISGDPTGGTVGVGATQDTPCVRDSSFAYGSAPGVTVTSVPC